MKTNQKKDTPLNDLLVVLLLIGSIGGFFQIISCFSNFSPNPVVTSYGTTLET